MPSAPAAAPPQARTPEAPDEGVWVTRAEAPAPSTPPGEAEGASAQDHAAVLARMSGARRAAVLLVALGVEAASRVLTLLDDEAVEAVSVEIARAQNVPGEQVEAVLSEYNDLALARSYVSQGGSAFARRMLETALGGDRAEEVMMKVEAAMEVSAFHMLHTVDLHALRDFLEKEHPQTVAFILTQLNPRKAAALVDQLSPEVQREVVARVATMGPPSPEVLREVEDVIRRSIGDGLGDNTGARGGVDKVAEILSATSRATERAVLDGLREEAPELAASIKSLMFVFDDLVHLGPRDLQKVLMQVEQRDLALALKGAPEELHEKVLQNVSERVAEAVREEVELLGSVAVSEVDDAQARILDAAGELEARGEVTLSRQPVERI